MSSPLVAPYGSWKSPIQARQIAEGTIRLGEVALVGEEAWWSELRPTEGGRNALVRRTADGRSGDALPAGLNARTRVHEYGGGAWLVCGESVVFANFADQRLYRAAAGPGGAAGLRAEPVTPAAELRYADFVCDPKRSRLICVREDHREEGEAANTIAAVYPHAGGHSEVLAGGNDFYAAPRISPDGSMLAWLTWNHPDMPWDATELRVAPIRDDGSLGKSTLVAGGPGESIVQPRWSPQGVLHFVSDRGGWWNLHRLRDGRVERLTGLEAEFAGPAWVFGQSNYDFAGGGRIACCYVQDGLSRLAVLDASGRLTPLETPYTSIGSVSASEGRVGFIGGSAERHSAVVLLDLASGRCEELRRSGELEVDAGYLSSPEAIEFATEGGLTAHALFYAPRNRDFVGPRGERPPLVVMAHGGPTGSTSSALRLGIQYYTSRGIAVLDVNYGGSTGYGRAYRERLHGQWGVVDVDDCCNGAKHLAGAGRVDGRRMAMTGGSAGGYTTLACLAFRDVFAAGSSHFGISDCEALARETHKFESRYLDRLIAPYPQGRARYRERSPIHHTDRLSCPIVFFQGLEDRIVPPNQARMMVDALRRKKLPTALVEFEGEQHGFRQADNIRRAIEGEFYFFARIFGFEPADELAPLAIENLPGGG